MSPTSYDAAKIHVSCLRFSVDLDVDIHVQPGLHESVQVLIDDRSMIVQAADAVATGARAALGVFSAGLWGRSEPARARGTVVTFPGRHHPPKVSLRAPWGSPAHALFAGEFDRMIGALMGIEPALNYKFDVEATIGGRAQRFIGCFVTDDPQQEGEFAVITLSVDYPT